MGVCACRSRSEVNPAAPKWSIRPGEADGTGTAARTGGWLTARMPTARVAEPPLGIGPLSVATTAIASFPAPA